MKGPPTRSRWGGYHLARPGGPPEPKGVQYPKTTNLKPQTHYGNERTPGFLQLLPHICVEFWQIPPPPH